MQCNLWMISMRPAQLTAVHCWVVKYFSSGQTVLQHLPQPPHQPVTCLAWTDRQTDDSCVFVPVVGVEPGGGCVQETSARSGADSEAVGLHHQVQLDWPLSPCHWTSAGSLGRQACLRQKCIQYNNNDLLLVRQLNCGQWGQHNRNFQSALLY